MPAAAKLAAPPRLSMAGTFTNRVCSCDARLPASPPPRKKAKNSYLAVEVGVPVCESTWLEKKYVWADVPMEAKAIELRAKWESELCEKMEVKEVWTRAPKGSERK